MGRKPRYRKSAMAGLLIVDKPLGWSSMDVVRKVRHAAGFVKTGHGGTLDPLATGVVVCCIGHATKSVEALMGMQKTYDAKIDLSAFTPTDDAEGEREEVAVETPPSEDDVRAALETFVGEIQQVPPLYSAIHVDGKRAYKLARKGEDVELEARTVRIDSIELLEYEFPHVRVLVRSGKGVYVRSLARDLGKALGTGGYLSGLRRTAVGPYRVEDAVTAERLLQPIGQFDLLDAPKA
ncbi:MAG: tRNA pseudouridine(55) synthase TruB [Planctomycetota bacterium]|nr:tRNA pseudouridine(55) synthase TruB [Planctomycetota bacterium]